MTKDRANDSDDKAKKAEAPSASDRVSESGVVDSGDKARRLSSYSVTTSLEQIRAWSKDFR